LARRSFDAAALTSLRLLAARELLFGFAQFPRPVFSLGHAANVAMALRELKRTEIQP
jgi:hypothetical protein